EMLASRLDPFHRAAQSTRAEWNQQILRIELFFDAESAAHVWHHYPDRVLRNAQHARGQAASRVRPLAADPDNQLARDRIKLACDAACLDRHTGITLHGESLADDHLRGAEGCIDVAKTQRPPGAHVIGRIGM